MILYIQTAFLGDLLLSIPTLKRLRQLYPQKKIHLLCRKGLGDFFKQNALVDEVFDSFKGNKPTLKEAQKIFIDKEYDLLICPHQSIRSSLIVRKINAHKKIGYESLLNRFIFDELISRPMKWPESIRQLSLLRNLDSDLAQHLVAIGVKTAPFDLIPNWSSMLLEGLHNRSAFRSHLVNSLHLEREKKIIMLAPGSVWATKRWGASRFIELAQLLITRGDQVILIGSPTEKELSEYIQGQVPDVINITGETQISQMIELIAGADTLICNDSGAMHMASLAQTPTVAIFGPTVQSFGYQPWNESATVVENSELRCRPCASHGGKTCPIGTHICMTSIQPQSILDQIDRILLKTNQLR